MTTPIEVPDELVASAMAGDRAALARVLAIIQRPIGRYCRARMGAAARSAVSAEDIVQEVCLAVVTALPGYRTQGRPFMAFVYGIASHKVVDARRHVARDRSEPVGEVPETMEVGEGPEQRALQAEESGLVERMLAHLPDRQREILVLRIAVGLSAQETADALGSTPGAIRVAQHRALSRLRTAVSAATVGESGRQQCGV